MPSILRTRPPLDPELLRAVETRTESIAIAGALDPSSFDYTLREDQLEAMRQEVPDLVEASRIELEVESHSYPELKELLHFGKDDLVGRWFHGWYVQEPSHGKIEQNYVHAYNAVVSKENASEIPKPSPKPNATNKQRLASVLSHFESLQLPILATVCRIGAAHESLTFESYRKQNARRKQAGLNGLAYAGGKIAAQEIPHREGYKDLDELYTATLRPTEHKIAEWMLAANFSPLGVTKPDHKPAMLRMATGVGLHPEAIMKILHDQNVLRYFGGRAIRAIEDAYRDLFDNTQSQAA